MTHCPVCGNPQYADVCTFCVKAEEEQQVCWDDQAYQEMKEQWEKENPDG